MHGTYVRDVRKWKFVIVEWRAEKRMQEKSMNATGNGKWKNIKVVKKTDEEMRRDQL